MKKEKGYLTIEIIGYDDDTFKINQSDSGLTKFEILGILQVLLDDNLKKVNKNSNEEREISSNTYENQINDENSVMVVDWANEVYEQEKMSNRLHNLLIDPRKFGGMTIKQLTYKQFIQFRNCGISSWDELVKLRGY